MGITIDDCILALTEEHKTASHENKQVLDKAIDTMRKYQKIAFIINTYDVTWEFHHMKPTIDKIREVIEADKLEGEVWE